MVTARDGAPDYRLATATVTVKVIDVEDEVPIFRQSSYEARVKENMPDHTVIQVTVSRTLTISQFWMAWSSPTDAGPTLIFNP